MKRRFKQARRIAFDFGGVLVARHTSRDDLIWDSDNYQDLPHVRKAIYLVTLAVKHYGRKNVYIVSKAREPKKVLSWLRDKSFLKKTGMRSSNVRLHKTRKGKVHSYVRHGIDTVVEDRLENLRDAIGVGVPHLYYFGRGRDADDPKYADVLKHVRRVQDMAELEKELFG
jgi:hypothetical protein